VSFAVCPRGCTSGVLLVTIREETNRLKHWTGSIWIRIQPNGELLWARCWTFMFHIMRGISWLAEELLALQEEFCWLQAASLVNCRHASCWHSQSPIVLNAWSPCYCIAISQSYRLPTTWRSIEQPIRCSIAAAGLLVPVSFQAHSAILITKCLVCIRRSS